MLKSENTKRFNHINVLSQPGEDWKGYRGRITQATSSDILMDIAGNKINQFIYFLCGPTGFMQTVTDTLIDFEVPEKQIHKESFFTGDPKPKLKDQEKVSDNEFNIKIHLDGEEYEVTVPSSKSILEAALDLDIDMPFSCQSGLCTACRGKCVSGKVKMDEEEGLSKAEIEAGYVLPCVSHPLTDDVKIEIG